MTYLYEALDKPTRLYIKKCSHCGLKYFGKTVSEDIENYKGSGIRWQRHLKKHHAKSIHLWSSDWYYNTSIVRFATKFSNINKIVESKEWANLIPENGINGGGDCSQMRTERARDKATKTTIQNYGVDHPFKSKAIRNKAKKTKIAKYNKLPGQILTNNQSIEKRNDTNKKLYGSACAANRDGNVKSKETQKILNDRVIVKEIKCLLPITKASLSRAWWYKPDSELIAAKQDIVSQYQQSPISTKRDILLSRKEVRLIIMINQITPLSLGQNWFQRPDAMINDLYSNIIASRPKELDIALRSYHLLFPE